MQGCILGLYVPEGAEVDYIMRDKLKIRISNKVAYILFAACKRVDIRRLPDFLY